MPSYTSEMLQKVYDMAYNQFTVDDIALVIGVPVDELLADINNKRKAIYKSYHTGRIEAEAALRGAVLSEALSGSTPAMKHFIELIKHSGDAVTRQHLDESKTRKERAEARMKELEVKQREGTLVEREHVVHFFAELATTVKASFLNLPTAVAPELVGKTNAREIQAILKSYIVEKLQELARLDAF